MTKLFLNTDVLGFHLGNDAVEIYIRLTHMKLLLIFKAKVRVSAISCSSM